MNIADFHNSSQLTYWLAIGSYSLLFAFSIASKTAIFSAEDSLWANMRLSWAIKWRFWNTISLFLRWIFLWTYVLRSMDVRPRVYARTSSGSMHVRPKGVWTYVHRIYSWNVASIGLKTAGMTGRLRKDPFFLFQIAFSSGTFSNINMSDKITL